jgi:FkbM family methyltransferase
MLINFKSLCEKYNFIPSGIIHIGAHELEEMGDYLHMGVENIIWIEGNPEIVEKTKSRISSGNQILLSSLIFDEDDVEVDFNVTNNFQSSSILKLGKHKEYHPTIDVIKTIKLKTSRIETLLDKNGIRSDIYDFVNIDIQGVELRALRGFGKYLECVKYIYTEVNSGSVYEDNDLIGDIDSFLGELGFFRAETSMTQFEWGDAFYVRK